MSQQKTNAQKVFSETKIFTNFKIKKMKNLKGMTLNELKIFNGGELPYTQNAVNGQGLVRDLHNTWDFLRGVWDAL